MLAHIIHYFNIRIFFLSATTGLPINNYKAFFCESIQKKVKNSKQGELMNLVAGNAQVCLDCLESLLTTAAKSCSILVD